MAVAPPPVVVLAAPAGINHGAGLIGLGGRSLLACWYSGRTEAGRDVVILCARSSDAGKSWSAPTAASSPRQTALTARAPAKSVGNVVLARDSGGRLIMVAGEVQSRRIAGIETCRSWRCGRIDFRVSTDAGRSWSPPTRLDDRPGALPRSRPFEAPGQGVLLPVYQEGRRPSVLRLDLSALAPGRRPRTVAMAMSGSAGLLQPSLAATPQGVAAYLRDHRRRFVWVARLDPAAAVWSAPRATDLPNPDSAVEAFNDAGKVALVYNPSRKDRRSLALAFSDDGVRFGRGCTLVSPGAAGEAAYPAVTRLDDGWGLIFSISGKRRIAFMRLDRAFLDTCAAEPRS